jgi:hypothetical protein
MTIRIKIESILRNLKETATIDELLKKIPEGIGPEEFYGTLNLLEINGKIILSKEKLLWIYTPREKLNKLITRGIEI